jgi:hypothetical protein
MTTQTMLRQTASAALAVTLLLPHAATLSESPQANKFTIPKTWDDAAMADLEVPLANPIGSPKQISADYYYRIPVRPIYKQYPVLLSIIGPDRSAVRLRHDERTQN